MKQRVLTAVILIPPVLLAVFLYNPFVFWAASALAVTLAFSEFCRIAGSKPRPPFEGYALLIATIVACVWSTRGPWAQPDFLKLTFITSTILILAAIGATAAVFFARGKRGWLVTTIAGLWIFAPFASLLVLKQPFGDVVPTFEWSSPLLLALVPLWVGDSLAIFVGKALGKHLLAPRISPKKTIEGAVANLVGCVGGAIGIGLLIGAPLTVGLGAGIASGVFGQAGDLLESAMKRSAEVKDSGTLLPGHGGLLDRIDSILLSAPAIALIVVTLGRT